MTKEYACDKLNSLLDETYKTIAEKEISKVNRNSHLNLTNSELHFIEAVPVFYGKIPVRQRRLPGV